MREWCYVLTLAQPNGFGGEPKSTFRGKAQSDSKLGLLDALMDEHGFGYILFFDAWVED